jgi:bifunctional DNA-binding transcriptional regulator/antitoxin component of YhaV-PrlF toxin-antitoxin module
MSESMEVKVERDGKISIPPNILGTLGVEEGDRFSLSVNGEKIILTKIAKKITAEYQSQPRLDLVYRPELTTDLLSGEPLKRDLDLEARLMTIPLFAQLARRGFFIVSEKNRAVAFGFRTVEEAITSYLSQGKITKKDLERAGITWPKPEG